jgi:hypothetical protein
LETIKSKCRKYCLRAGEEAPALTLHLIRAALNHCLTIDFPTELKVPTSGRIGPISPSHLDHSLDISDPGVGSLYGPNSTPRCLWALIQFAVLRAKYTTSGTHIGKPNLWLRGDCLWRIWKKLGRVNLGHPQRYA